MKLWLRPSIRLKHSSRSKFLSIVECVCSSFIHVFPRSSSLPTTIKSISDESPSSSADLFVSSKKRLITSKSMDPFETKNGRPPNNILQPVISDVKTMNGQPRSRFGTNKLNCCKSRSQETDVDTLGRANVRKVETVTMPKLQQANGNRPATETRQRKTDGKKSSHLLNRDSMPATQDVFRKMSLRKPSEAENNRFIGNDYRRQSLDENATNGKRLTRQLSTIGDGDGHGRLQPYSTISDKFDSNRKLTSMLNSSNKKHLLNDDHLKSLENKIRKHKIDAMRHAKEFTNGAQHTKFTLSSGPNSFHPKMDQFVHSKQRLKEHANRINGSYRNIRIIDNGLGSQHNAKASHSRSAMAGHNYGIISASELYKLRTESII